MDLIRKRGERVKDAAISDPMYNDDFTQMSVDLRDNIYWSDCDDLVYTVEDSGWSANLNRSMAEDGRFQCHLPSDRTDGSNFEARWSV